VTTFRVATEADDEVLRAMLRENGMRTWVDMTMEREPSFFAGKNLYGRDWAVIAEDKGDVIGMYTASVMPVHLNGQPTKLGYLGGLRVNPNHRRRIRHLREGYASIGRFAPESVPWWFTVVAAENDGARRLLEAGVPGLPPYHPQGDYVTFALPVSRGKRRGLWRRVERSADVSSAVGERHARQPSSPAVTAGDCGRDARAPDVVSLYNKAAAQFQYSPVLDRALAEQLEFYVCGDAVAALWDQRAFKQIVARRYRHPSLIPFYNTYARLARRIPLPPEGRALEQTFIAFLTMPPDYALLQDLLSYCRTPAASIGVHAKSPLIPVIERFKPVRYPARIYAVVIPSVVERPGCAEARDSSHLPPRSLDSARDDGRPAQPEAALL
jgi:Acetyltransferase (GNAT) domain